MWKDRIVLVTARAVWKSGDLSVFKGDLKERPFTRSVMKEHALLI
jgi:hypothetical protein